MLDLIQAIFEEPDYTKWSITLDEDYKDSLIREGYQEDSLSRYNQLSDQDFIATFDGVSITIRATDYLQAAVVAIESPYGDGSEESLARLIQECYPKCVVCALLHVINSSNYAQGH